MPLYEYQCEDCGVVFEARQKFTDPPLTACGQCGGSVQKLISRTAFSLKGGGWYEQGYHDAPAKPCETAGKSDACAACPKAVNE